MWISSCTCIRVISRNYLVLWWSSKTFRSKNFKRIKSAFFSLWLFSGQYQNSWWLETRRWYLMSCGLNIHHLDKKLGRLIKYIHFVDLHQPEPSGQRWVETIKFQFKNFVLSRWVILSTLECLAPCLQVTSMHASHAKVLPMSDVHIIKFEQTKWCPFSIW
jgi:hypothetical protein